MTMNYLRRLADRVLPFSSSDCIEIDHMAILNGARLITANIPEYENHTYGGDGVVTAITQTGRDAVTAMRARATGPSDQARP